MGRAAGAARHHLAARQADVHGHGAADLRGEVRHGNADRERGAGRPLRVVAMRHRRPEHGHDAVADVLVDRAAEATDDAVDPREEALEQAVHLLGVQLPAEVGVADQIAEQHGHLAPLPRRTRRRRHGGKPVTAGGAVLMVGLDGKAARRAALRQRGAAAGAEPGPCGIVEAAAGAAHR
jgi:hypothetical protein